MTTYTLLPVTVASALVCGTLLSLMVSIREPLAERLGVAEARVSWLLLALNLVLVPMLPLAGVLVDTFGVEHVLIGGAVLAALAISVLAVRDGSATALT